MAKTFVFISDSNGTTPVDKKGNKEILNENAASNQESSIEDEIVNLDPNDILINTVAESLADAVKTEL